MHCALAQNIPKQFNAKPLLLCFFISVKSLNNIVFACVIGAERSSPVPAPLGAGRAMRTQLLAVSVKHSGLRQAAGPRTRRM